MTSVPTTPGGATAPPFDRYQSTRLPVRRFTVDEYHRMIDQGYFASDERFELLEGWIVAKVSRNPPHDGHVSVGRRVLDRRLPPRWHVRVQCAVTTGDSEPEPDLAVVSGVEEDYFTRHPDKNDVALVVEVSSSTLDDDRVVMSRIYARAGVPVYWIINLVDQQVEVYEHPSGPVQEPAFGRQRVFRRGEGIPLVVAGTDVGPVPVSELLP